MPELVGYLLLFLAVGVGFIFVHLLVGKLVRPDKPNEEKMTIYECGEPTIGSAWVQFDLRFYVVALLFVIFDVEVAFFFPWAVVFGQTNALAQTPVPQTFEQREAFAGQLRTLIPPHAASARQRDIDKLLADRRAQAVKVAAASGSEQALLQKDLDQIDKQLTAQVDEEAGAVRAAAPSFALIAFLDLLVFFGVILVGFAYLWRRGDLDWVRTTAAQENADPTAAVPTV